jgi:hypothetical protein
VKDGRLAMLFTRDGLAAAGFEGFQSVRDLRRTKLADVPCDRGVYVVLWPGQGEPGFRRVSAGGWFKCQDPSDPIADLRQKWVDRAQALYIGRAAGVGGGRRDLRMRIGQLLAFGAGLPIDHRGGRYLWQIAKSENLVVCWKVVPDPAVAEGRLINQFERAYGRLPFANLRR